MPSRANRGRRAWRAAKPLVFAVALIPFVLLVRDGVSDALGANPIEEITHRTGRWGLTFLMLALAATPVRLIVNWSAVMTLRRMLGLFAFFYLALHFCTYVALDQFFSVSSIVEDVAERPYVTVGFTSFVLLIPLAVTSTNGWVRRLGGHRWARLHKLVYVAAVGGVLHFWWLVKADTRDPMIYAIVLAALLGIRLWKRQFKGRARSRRRPAGAPAS